MTNPELCPVCGRRLVVCDSKRIGGTMKQYIGCRRQRGGCGYRPENNIRTIPALVGKKIISLSSALGNIQ